MSKNNTIVSKKIQCKLCGKYIASNSWFRHIQTEHSNLPEGKKCAIFNRSCGEHIKLPIEYDVMIIKYWFKYNIVSSFEVYKNKIIKLSKICNYIKAVELYEPFTEEHLNYYHNTFIEFRKHYPFVNTSREYCYSLFGGDKNKGEDYYNRIVLPKNPYHQHGGKLSPFSKKFVAYENLTEEEKQNNIHNTVIKSVTTAINNSNNNTRIDFYIKRGATPEEAEQLLKERQTTFLLSICIEKYGLEEGCKRFTSRQKKWQHNLVSNPESNARQIAGRIKATEVSFSNRTNKEYVEKQKQTRSYKCCYSVVSQEFFDLLMQVLKDEYKKEFPDVRYASANSEFKVHIDDTHFRLLDFYIPSLNKAIEFDGTYWHKDDFESDKQRELDIEKVLSGIKFYRVDESEFYNDPYKIILGAINYILKK